MDDPVKVLYPTLWADKSVVRMDDPVKVLYSTLCADKSVVRMDDPISVEYSMESKFILSMLMELALMELTRNVSINPVKLLIELVLIDDPIMVE